MNEGVVRCWGFGDEGQLGYAASERIGDNEHPAVAGHVNVGDEVLELAMGGYHGCALLPEGRIRCWGLGVNGQLGYGNADNVGDAETPAAPGDVPGGGRVAQVAAGQDHTCVLLEDGSVRCWGNNQHGQLGYGHTDNLGDDEAVTDLPAVELGEPALQVVAGERHTCALLNSGDVRCFGHGGRGQLGTGNIESIGDNELPIAVDPVELGEVPVALSAGGDHTCALLSGGRVRCWGYGSLGRLGYGNTTAIGDNETPAAAGDVSVGGAVEELRAAQYNTCALMEDAGVRCWGFGGYGLVGLGVTNLGDAAAPSTGDPVDLGGDALDVDVGFFHACAVMSDGDVRCWGLGSWGALGYANEQTIGDNEAPSSAGDIALY